MSEIHLYRHLHDFLVILVTTCQVFFFFFSQFTLFLKIFLLSLHEQCFC